MKVQSCPLYHSSNITWYYIQQDRDKGGKYVILGITKWHPHKQLGESSLYFYYNITFWLPNMLTIFLTTKSLCPHLLTSRPQHPGSLSSHRNLFPSLGQICLSSQYLRRALRRDTRASYTKEGGWRLRASRNLVVSMDSGHGLAPNRCQAMTWTNADLYTKNGKNATMTTVSSLTALEVLM